MMQRKPSGPKGISTLFDGLGMTYRMRQRGCIQHDWTEAKGLVHSKLKELRRNVLTLDDVFLL